MFESVTRLPDDAILGLIQQVGADPNPKKAALGVGVYRDETGVTPILDVVKEAERLLLQTENTKAYIGSHGDPKFARHIPALLLGKTSPVVAEQRVSATETPGGCGALRLGADLIAGEAKQKPTRIWVPQPTWPNHVRLFSAAGLQVEHYPYVDKNNRLDFDAMMSGLRRVPAGDVVLFHACCHNPTGFDPGVGQWKQILEVVRERNLFPFVDFAYQGFGEGLEEDAFAVRLLAENVSEMLIAQSCSKNFGIYRERTGTLLAIAPDAEQTVNVRSHIGVTARGSYSHPPTHGGAVVDTILSSPELTARWREEVDGMRARIHTMRNKLADGLAARGLGERFDFLKTQRGMFSYTGLSKAQVGKLKDKYSVYMVDSGRMSVPGLNQKNVDYVCEAIAEVVKADA
ncbi:MAG TPA: amino acid aminotransferase [Nevskiaceae bacterium]